MTAQLPSRERLEALASGNAFTCVQDDEATAMARALLAAHEQEPVGIVRYVCAGLERPGIHVSLYDTSLPDGTELFTRPAPSPAYGDEYQGAREDLAIWKRRALESEEKLRQQPAPVPAVPDDWKGQLTCTHCTPKSVSQVSTGTSVGVAPVHAVPELVSVIGELTSAIRSINRAPHHIAKGVDDDEPCYWQRKEWIDWVLELASSADEKSRAAMLNGGKS